MWTLLSENVLVFKLFSRMGFEYTAIAMVYLFSTLSANL